MASQGRSIHLCNVVVLQDSKDFGARGMFEDIGAALFWVLNSQELGLRAYPSANMSCVSNALFPTTDKVLPSGFEQVRKLIED